MKKILLLTIALTTLILTACASTQRSSFDSRDTQAIEKLNEKLSGRGVEYNYYGPNRNVPLNATPQQ